jgi:hypothetical protein
VTHWFARPVLHVTDVEASLDFYVNRLGSASPWRYGEQTLEGQPFDRLAGRDPSRDDESVAPDALGRHDVRRNWLAFFRS